MTKVENNLKKVHSRFFYIKYFVYISIVIIIQTNKQMKNQIKTKLTVDEFEDILLDKEREAEDDIDIDEYDFSATYDELMDLAIEYTYNHFMELGYTEDEVLEVHDEWNS